MRAAALATVLLAAGGPAWAVGAVGRGTTAAGFLKLGVDARAAAMGEAYAAVADEASALFWNPAALTRIERRSVVLMHAAHLDQTSFDYLAYGQRLGHSAVGLSAHRMDSGRIAEFDDAGRETGGFSPQDLALSLGAAHRIGDLSLGVAGKWIRSQIIDRAQTFAFDAGALSEGWLGGGLSVAAAVSNVGGHLRYESEAEELPLSGRLGAAYKLGRGWLVSGEAQFPNDDDPAAAVGVESSIDLKEAGAAALRVGCNSRTLGDVDGVTGVALGLGYRRKVFSADYAFAPLGSVGTTHRFSLTFRF